MSKEKLDIFAQPLPFENDSRQLDMNKPEDYAFAFEIGLKPELDINLDDLQGTFYKIQVTDEVIDDEINRLRSRYGKMTEPETVNRDEEVLNVKFTEADAEGHIVEGGIEKDNSLLVKYFTPEVQQELMGKKKDDSILIQLDKAFEKKERDWVLEDLTLDKSVPENAEKFFNLTIAKIGFVEKAELNEDLFNSAFPERNVTDEESLRNAVKEDIQKYYDQQSSNQLQDQLYHHLIDNIKISFPEKFLKRWLEEGSEKIKTPEEAEKELPTFLNQLKWTLISSKLINENDIKVEPEEIKNFAQRQLVSYMQGQAFDDMPWLDEYANRMMKDKKFVEETYSRLQTEKLFYLLESKAVKTEEPVSLSEFEKKVHHHHH
jgi:trigger factor